YNQQDLRPGSMTYSMSSAFNRAGLMTDETYPSTSGSGMTVHTDYDSAGRIAGVKDGTTPQYYAGNAPGSGSNIQYTPHGAVTAMNLGNGLIEVNAYNSRLQLADIKLGTSTAPTGKLELKLDYGITKNNGNVMGQTILIGQTEVGTQSYSYDG